MNQTWEEIYKSKSSRDLYKIFRKGTINEKRLAKAILKDREFEFDNLDKYKHEWELEKLLKEEDKSNSNLLQWFANWPFGFDPFSVFPIVLLLIIIIIIGDLLFQILGKKEKDIVNTLIILAVISLLEILSLRIFRVREEKKRLRQERINYLKKKINKNDTDNSW